MREAKNVLAGQSGRLKRGAERNSDEQEDVSQHIDAEAPPIDVYDGRLLEESAGRFGRMVADWHEGGNKRGAVERQMALGRLVRDARRARKLSRKALSEKVGLEPGILFLLENGLLSPPEAEKALNQVAREVEVDFIDPFDWSKQTTTTRPLDNIP